MAPVQLQVQDNWFHCGEHPLDPPLPPVGFAPVSLGLGRVVSQVVGRIVAPLLQDVNSGAAIFGDPNKKAALRGRLGSKDGGLLYVQQRMFEYITPKHSVVEPRCVYT